MTMGLRHAVAPVVIHRRLRGGIDFLLSALVLGVLVSLAASSYRVYIARARVAEVLSLAITIKQDLGVAHAQTGQWPVSAILSVGTGENRGQPEARVFYEEGAFTFVLGDDAASQRLSFRAAISESTPRAPVLWLCGYVSPPSGYRVIARNQTDIPTLYLPAACRGDT